MSNQIRSRKALEGLPGDGAGMEAPVEASVGAQKNVDLAMDIVGAP